MWVGYALGTSAGLMVISSISGMARKSMGDAAFVAVAVMAFGLFVGSIFVRWIGPRREPTGT